MPRSFHRRSVSERNGNAGFRQRDYTPRDAGAKASPPNWRDVSPAIVHDFVAAALESQTLVSLSPTSDGGALHIFLLQGRVRFDAYPHSSDEIEDALVEGQQLMQNGES